MNKKQKKQLEEAKLIISFKNKTEITYFDTKEWCKDAYDKLMIALRNPKNDVFNFTNEGQFRGEGIRLSEVMFARFLENKK